MAEIYGFEFEVAQRLKEMAGVPTQVSKARTAPLKRPPQMIGGGGDGKLAITPAGGIAARTTTSVPHTFPSANCRLLDEVTGDYYTPDQTLVVYNSTRIAVAAGRVIQIKQIGTRYFVDVDGDC